MVSCMGALVNLHSTSYDIYSSVGNNGFCRRNNFENSCVFVLKYSMLLHKGFTYSAITGAAVSVMCLILK